MYAINSSTSGSKSVSRGCGGARHAAVPRAPQPLPAAAHRRSSPQTIHTLQQRGASLVARAAVEEFGGNPVRQAIGGFVHTIYKVTAGAAPVEPGTSPLWTSLIRLDTAGVKAAIAAGANVNERNQLDDTPLLMIAREGHYKYKPNDIPAALVAAGADLEAKDRAGLTALEVSLLAGWQNISEVLLKAGASTAGVAGIKGRLTCPDCKALVTQYQL